MADETVVSSEAKQSSSGGSTQHSLDKPNTSEVEKQQEKKLLSKHPGLGNKPAGSKFLQKRLSKGRMFFDSGDYNMTKTAAENRASSKIVSQRPTRIISDSSEPSEDDLTHNKSEDETTATAATATSDSHEEDEEDDDVMDPSKQAIPTADFLFLRRAARHMPMASSNPAIRRATVQTRNRANLADDGGIGGLLGDDELVADGPVITPNVMAKRRATLQVPSKLAD